MSAEGNSYLIRRAKVQDSLQIHEVHMSSIRELCRTHYSPQELQFFGNRVYNEAQRVQAIQEQVVWVLEVAGSIEGFCQLKPIDQHTYYLHALYLTKTVVGRSFARTLWNVMLEYMKVRGVREVTVHSSLNARGFYEKMGFQGDGAIELLLIEGHSMPSYPMKMSLSY